MNDFKSDYRNTRFVMKVLYRTAMDIAPKLLVTSESGRRR